MNIKNNYGYKDDASSYSIRRLQSKKSRNYTVTFFL